MNLNEPVSATRRLHRVAAAVSFRDRFLGLMGRRDLDRAFLWIPSCRSIHTCFMRGPIDVAFLDEERRVTALRPRLMPWRLASGGAGTYSVLELPAGFLEQHSIAIGDHLEWE